MLRCPKPSTSNRHGRLPTSLQNAVSAFFVISGPRRHILRNKAGMDLHCLPYAVGHGGLQPLDEALAMNTDVSLGFGHPRRIAPVGHPLQQSGQRRAWLRRICLGHAAAGPQRRRCPNLGPNALLARLGGGLFQPPTGLMYAPDPWNAPKIPSTLPWKATAGSASKATPA